MPRNLEHAQEWIRQELSEAQLSALHLATTIEDAVREADLAIDCVPDELESKLEIFCLLDRMAPPKTVLATPTTNMSIADLASCTYRPEKCVAIAHDAAELAGLTSGEVRLLTTSRTSPETIALVERFWSRLGLRPSVSTDPREALPARL
jgi:3-hydroxybutyryl-CoA dehydrogenase